MWQKSSANSAAQNNYGALWANYKRCSMPRKPPNCYIIAGPNGAGKTTFATRFPPLYANCRKFINPDLRVENGGHNVPEVDVRRRFGRTLRNLFKLYRPLLDTLHFFDNGCEPAELVFKDEAGKTTVTNATLYENLRGEFGP